VVREIGRRIGRSPSTVSRELRRHLKAHDKGIYDADLAHARTRDKARRERPGCWSGTPSCETWLRRSWRTPGACSRSPPGCAPNTPPARVAHLPRDDLLSPLPRQERRPEQGVDRQAAHRPTATEATPTCDRAEHPVRRPALLIHSRPEIVETRSRIGDWEGDLILGRHSRSAIGTLVERASRSVRLVHLPHGHAADVFIGAINPVLAGLPPAARRTLTWDQGSEMARDDLLADHFDHGVYFADPGSPWQLGSNENTVSI
jgi:transposase, IS30 family